MSAREKFAEWAGPKGYDLSEVDQPSRDGFTYAGTTTEFAYRAFVAAWLAAKADDAEICDGIVAWNMKTTSMLKPAHRANSIGAERGATECAAAIRDSAGDPK